MKGKMTHLLFVAAILWLFTGCNRGPVRSSAQSTPDPCAVALATHKGESKIDQEIIRFQDEATKARDPKRALDRLGWLFVAKARVSYDPGFYKLAEQCAACLESKEEDSAEALLLRGHVLHNLHRFKEAEKVARKLVATRGLAFDHGLLGDLLMEQGRLNEAKESYQKMIDLKPCLQSYSRVAHMRWLKGDLRGALEMMRMATMAGSARDSEAVAWAYSRLAFYELQAGDLKKAAQSCQAALAYQSDYAAALLVQGRVFLAQHKVQEAVESLRSAARLNPLPEYQWALSESLRRAGDIEGARSVEEELASQGALSDPRTFALYLASRGEDTSTAVELAKKELAGREDIFTLDAVAWSLAAAGRTEAARSIMKRALSEGTQEARLFYHAGVIAAAAGHKKEAFGWFDQARKIEQMLLPSEREDLAKKLSEL
jgi:tetratricopeptide (TPR) repeat protein